MQENSSQHAQEGIIIALKGQIKNNKRRLTGTYSARCRWSSAAGTAALVS